MLEFKLVEDVYEGTTVKYFTDGHKSIKLKPGDVIPDGFHEGRTFNSNPWNRGLKGKDDERVKNNMKAVRDARIKNGSYVAWNAGLTKETDERIKQAGEEVSKATQGRVAWNKGIPMSAAQKERQSAAMMGKTPWNKGLTKETNASVLATSNKLLGHDCFVKDWEAAKQKEYATKKKNHSFNSSKVELDLLNKLRTQYGEENVIHQYRDERYPYNCDIYVVPEDLFIEVNGTVEHNGRPYDKTNPDDIAEANYILTKANEKGPQSRYWNIYNWWTTVDPKKLETLRKNGLNFKIIYPNGLVIDK